MPVVPQELAIRFERLDRGGRPFESRLHLAEIANDVTEMLYRKDLGPVAATRVRGIDILCRRVKHDDSQADRRKKNAY